MPSIYLCSHVRIVELAHLFQNLLSELPDHLPDFPEALGGQAQGEAGILFSFIWKLDPAGSKPVESRKANWSSRRL